MDHDLVIKDDDYTLIIHIDKFFPAPQYRLKKLLKLARFNESLTTRILSLQEESRKHGTN